MSKKRRKTLLERYPNIIVGCYCLQNISKRPTIECFGCKNRYANFVQVKKERYVIDVKTITAKLVKSSF